MIEDKLEDPRAFGDTPEVDPGTDANEPTEEEQMDYDLLTVRARKMMFGKGRENVLKLLGSSESPAKGIGQAASMIIKTLMEAAKQGGREIAGETALAAGAEIASDLSELGKSSGVFEYESDEEEDRELQDALLWGVKFYGDGMIARGEITPEMQQQAQQQMQEGLAAEQSAAPKQKPVAAGVSQAVNAPGGGMINKAMQGGA